MYWVLCLSFSEPSPFILIEVNRYEWIGTGSQGSVKFLVCPNNSASLPCSGNYGLNWSFLTTVFV